MLSDPIQQAALAYHRKAPAGKLAIQPTKPLATQHDLSLAYSPGVAAACTAIEHNPDEAAALTARGNLVGVVTNGSAVLGLGNIGPLASKPVMEGKAVLFKKFAGIDAFDVEIDADNAETMISVIRALEPTFGAINLEDIKAPECFVVEETLKQQMNIPVFHDDQHGTAIIVAAAIRNALTLVDKSLSDIRLTCAGAGAAALACLNLLVSMGLRRENVTVCDVVGVVYEGRTELMDPYKVKFARDTEMRTLADAMEGVDVFLGLSAPNIVSQDMVAGMADKPVILALANPVPEITPENVRAVRSDAIVCTGRSDYPNQVNNVLCFPFIFRGALDCGATSITEGMKIACVEAIAGLVRRETDERVAQAYGLTEMKFGADYLIPKPFDPRLAVDIPMAVVKAAQDEGIARRPISDMETYHDTLSQFVYRSGNAMKPVFERAQSEPQRIVYTDGESEIVLRAVQVVVDEGIAKPILIGRPEVVQSRIERLGLRLNLTKDVELCNPQLDPRYNDYVAHYQGKLCRNGVTPALARDIVRTNTTVIGAIMLDRGEADALIAGPVGRFSDHLVDIGNIIGLRDDMHDYSALQMLVMNNDLLFMADTHVSVDLSAEEVAETTCVAARTVRRFGIVPKVALLSHSNFGTRQSPTALVMREALALVREIDPELEIDGEMHADSALSEVIRKRACPSTDLQGQANLLIFPNLDAANISFNLVKQITSAVPVGPILLGPNKPAHIVTTSITSRGMVNMSAVAAVDAAVSREIS